MKFIIGISTCLILMEFDGQVIERNLTDQWPHRIKLVSVTSVDFAGRIHDVTDVFMYLTNWSDVYFIDPHNDQPFVYNGRDFSAKRGIYAQLNREKARLRLGAYDRHGVAIVAETRIGLGVFAGQQVSIDHQRRSLSAQAIKHVLEKDSSAYSHIRAGIFAMSIFETNESRSTYRCFVDIFQNGYCVSVPVLIADQDRYRLTVVTAKHVFNVFEFNPADSQGVFGEHW